MTEDRAERLEDPGAVGGVTVPERGAGDFDKGGADDSAADHSSYRSYADGEKDRGGEHSNPFERMRRHTGKTFHRVRAQVRRDEAGSGRGVVRVNR